MMGRPISIGFVQFMPQAPPPHPVAPQPSDLGLVSHIGSEPSDPRAVWEAAGTLNCLARSSPPQFGQCATSLEERIKVSNVWWQGAQWYS